MHEIIVNAHVHTYLSDGHARYQDLATAAINSGVDVVITNDHNVFVQGAARTYSVKNGKAMIIPGMEIHDQNQNPQKNHMLIFFSSRDLTSFASDPQMLITQARQNGALSFLAHPFESSLPAFDEPEISWTDWGIRDFTGIELWNGFSEIKSRSRNLLDTIFYAFFPIFLARAPLPDALQLWDSLLAKGKPCVAIGGSDSHALQKKVFGYTKVIFPYTYHFHSINNHVLLDKPLSSNPEIAQTQLSRAFSNGQLHIGYDLPFPTKGFKFYAQDATGRTQMGETADSKKGITIHIQLPQKAECNLLMNGRVIKKWLNTRQITYVTSEPGIYRVECYTHYLGLRRGWIFSNPIFVR